MNEELNQLRKYAVVLLADWVSIDECGCVDPYEEGGCLFCKSNQLLSEIKKLEGNDNGKE